MALDRRASTVRILDERASADQRETPYLPRLRACRLGVEQRTGRLEGGCEPAARSALAVEAHREPAALGEHCDELVGAMRLERA